MSFAIFDSTASIVQCFDDRVEARDALAEIVRQDPEGADDYSIFEFDANGHPVGDALTGPDLGLNPH